jgi:hypothetical protein
VPSVHVTGRPMHREERVVPALAVTAVAVLWLRCTRSASARARHATVVESFTRQADAGRAALVLGLLDEPTHGSLAIAQKALVRARARLETGGESRAGDLAVLAAALVAVNELEQAILDSHAARALGARRPRFSLARLAAFDDQHPADDPLWLYQDPAHFPSWTLRPRLRRTVATLGAVLDDLRLLHTPEVEHEVLVFTLRVRALILFAAPWCGPFSSGVTPDARGRGPDRRPWTAACCLSLLTAATAPVLANVVIGSGTRATAARATLLCVEVPVALAAVFTTPSWPIAVFAVGGSNWWQRPRFHGGRLVLWMGAVAGGLGVGLGRHHHGGRVLLRESVATFVVSGVIGDSYGALLPATTALLGRILASAVASPVRARREAAAQLALTVDQLVRAAEALRRDPRLDLMEVEALALVRVAAKLGSAATPSRRRRRMPGLLKDELDDALTATGCAWSGSPHGALGVALSELADEPEPLTLLRASPYDDLVGSLRLRRRTDARGLRRVVRLVVAEAEHHGTGPLTTRFFREADRVVVRWANGIRTGSAQTGRGTGGIRLLGAVTAIEGATLDTRAQVDGGFVDLPPAARRFGVQISIPLAAFHDHMR